MPAGAPGTEGSEVDYCAPAMEGTQPGGWASSREGRVCRLVRCRRAAAAVNLFVVWGCRVPALKGDSSSVPARHADLYSKMTCDLNERVALFLNGGETSQSLTPLNLFDTTNDCMRLTVAV